MKNLIIMGLTAMLLFSLSLGISMFLTKSKEPETEKTEKKGSKEKKGDHDSKPSEDKHAGEKSYKPANELIAQGGIRDRESRLEKQESQRSLILADMRADREALEKLTKLVSAETASAIADAQAAKAIADPVKTETTTTQIKTKPTPEIDPKQYSKQASIWEAMPPESVASLVQQMADSGRLEPAAQILNIMKEKQVAKIFAAISDRNLVIQIIGRINQIKTVPSATDSK